MVACVLLTVLCVRLSGLMHHPRFCTYVHTGDACAVVCFGIHISHGYLMRYSE